MFEDISRDIPFPSEMDVTKKDIAALEELGKHINDLLRVMEAYRKGEKDAESVKKAFQKILKDAQSKNKLESHLASYVINELKYLNLQTEWNHKDLSGQSFLQEWVNGKISDEKTIQRCCKGLCSPAGVMVIRGCKPDLILKEYRNQ
jgi:ferritin